VQCLFHATSQVVTDCVGLMMRVLPRAVLRVASGVQGC
jgi:hypothetical protein